MNIDSKPRTIEEQCIYDFAVACEYNFTVDRSMLPSVIKLERENDVFEIHNSRGNWFINSVCYHYKFDSIVKLMLSLWGGEI